MSRAAQGFESVGIGVWIEGSIDDGTTLRRVEPHMTLEHPILRSQGIYYLLTGVWPLVHMPSFESITGPKTDDWLVQMVGLLVFVIGGTLLLAVRQAVVPLETLVLSIGSAGAFTAIDVWHVARGRISPIYLADAVLELAIIVLLVWARSRRSS